MGSELREENRVRAIYMKTKGTIGMRKRLTNRRGLARACTFACAVALAVAVAPLAACSQNTAASDAGQPQGQDAGPASDAGMVSDAGPASDALLAGAGQEEQGKPVSTPVGTLVCPASWGDAVQVADTTSNGCGSISFSASSASAENGSVQLFSLEFGDTGKGYELGSVTGASGEPIKVSLDIAQVQESGGAVPEGAKTLSELQDGVNDLLDQIYRLDGFKAASK